MQHAEQSGQDAGHQNAFGPQSAGVSATKWAGMMRKRLLLGWLDVGQRIPIPENGVDDDQ